MTGDTIAALVHQIRATLRERSDLELPPLPPPATQAEIDRAETDLGEQLPTQLRDLYGVARGGYIGLTDLVPIDGLASHTDLMLEMWSEIQLECGEYLPTPSPAAANDQLIAFGSQSDSPTIFTETATATLGRVVLFDTYKGSEFRWSVLASDIEGLLRWVLHAVELGAITVTDHPAAGLITQVIHPAPALSTEAARNQTAAFIELYQQLRPTIDAAGGTGAYFGLV